jgi:hypothetical protein
MWNEAVNYPPKNSGATRPDEWITSDLIWIQSRAIFSTDANGNNTDKIIEEPKIFLGHCVWPKIPIGYKPISNKTIDNPATNVIWGDGITYYESKGAKIDATHWQSCVKPGLYKE